MKAGTLNIADIQLSSAKQTQKPEVMDSGKFKETMKSVLKNDVTNTESVSVNDKATPEEVENLKSVVSNLEDLSEKLNIDMDKLLMLLQSLINGGNKETSIINLQNNITSTAEVNINLNETLEKSNINLTEILKVVETLQNAATENNVDLDNMIDSLLNGDLDSKVDIDLSKLKKEISSLKPILDNKMIDLNKISPELLKDLNVDVNYSNMNTEETLPILNVNNKLSLLINTEKTTQSLDNEQNIPLPSIPNVQTANFKNAFNKVETAILPKTDIQTNVDNLVNNIKIFNDNSINGQSQIIVVRLSPRELGNITIELNMKEKMVSGIINVENAKAKEMLDSCLGNLKVNLEKQNIGLGNLDVNLNHSNSNQEQQNEHFKYMKNLREYSSSLMNKFAEDKIANRQYIVPNSKDNSINILV